MKKILFIVCVLMASVAFGQGVRLRTNLVGFAAAEFAYIPGYTKLNVRYEFIAMAIDSGFHVPQYNGVPSGVRTGVWQADGAIAADTLNGYFYQYWNGAWVKYAKYSDIAAAAPGLQDVITTDPTLTGDNTIAGGGNNFTWTGLNNWRIEGPDSDNYLRYNGGYTFLHTSTFGTSYSALQNSYTNGFTINASDGTSEGIISANPTYSNLEISSADGVSGLENRYTGGQSVSFLAAGNPYVGMYLDRHVGVRIGKGTAINSFNIRGLRIDTSRQVYLDSIDAGPGVYALRIDADGKVTYADTSSGSGTQGLQDVITQDATLTTNNTIAAGANFLAITGSSSSGTLSVTSTGTGAALSGTGTSTGVSASSVALPLSITATNTAASSSVEAVSILRSAGSPAVGYGANINFYLRNAELSGTPLANTLTSKWADPASATRTSQFDILGVNSAAAETFMNIQPSGVVRVNNLADTLATLADVRAGGTPAVGDQGTILQTSNGAAAWKYDTTTLVTFTAGANFAADTAAFTDSTIYGSFKLMGNDTFYVTGVSAVLYSNNAVTDTLGIQITYNDTINVIGSHVFAATYAINNETTGQDADGDDFTGSVAVPIPPGNWVWLKSPTVVEGRKPYHLSVSIIGYKKRVN